MRLNFLSLGEDELAYVYAWHPTTSWSMDNINENLAAWQARVYGDMQMVWEVRVLD